MTRIRKFEHKGYTYSVRYYSSDCGVVTNASVPNGFNLAAGFSISVDGKSVHAMGPMGGEAHGESIEQACALLWDILLV